MQNVWRWINNLRAVAQGSHGRRAGWGIILGLASMVAAMALRWDVRNQSTQALAAAPSMAQFDFPTVPPAHEHVRMLLENAMRYVAPETGIIEARSGYPVEGWNCDPSKGLSLRTFTQLTAIGEWVELLANVAAGHADTPYLSREEALSRLELAVRSLRHDQKDPDVSTKGLLGNFLDLAAGKRLGPLASEVGKRRFLDAFGPEKGEAIWKSLVAKGWIAPNNGDQEAAVRRGANYGWAFFDGPLAPYADEATKTKIMGLLDQRVVMVVFGDNANLTSSMARAIGALLHPEIKDRPKVKALRSEMERFLEDQREGYAYLYDAKAGLFTFGWDATRNRFLGWQGGDGQWQAGHMDYLVNEFRGPTRFVVLRYGLPMNAVRNLGFKLKPYRTQDGRDLYVPAPWEGSAFQALGLAISMGELQDPSWRTILDNIVEIELDYARRNRLPGFLSECYTGEGVQYTGDVGIPEIAVTTMPRITNVPSLYTLGVSYMIAPDRIEQFLAANWSAVSRLLTDHGPWEGLNVARQEPVQVQTSAHTLALILGLLGTEPENMMRYLDSKGLAGRLGETFAAGVRLDLMADGNQVFAWAEKGSVLKSTRDKGSFQVKGDHARQVGIAIVSASPEGVNLSGAMLSLRYHSAEPIDRALIAFKPAASAPDATPKIPNELFTRLPATGDKDGELQIPLPAVPGLFGIKEVVITYEHGKNGGPVDLAITRLALSPLGE